MTVVLVSLKQGLKKQDTKTASRKESRSSGFAQRSGSPLYKPQPREPQLDVQPPPFSAGFATPPSLTPQAELLTIAEASVQNWSPWRSYSHHLSEKLCPWPTRWRVSEQVLLCLYTRALPLVTPRAETAKVGRFFCRDVYTRTSDSNTAHEDW